MNKPIISLLMPTRGRPKLAKRFLDSVVNNTAYLDKVEVIIYVDNDDIISHRINHSLINVRRIIGPKKSMGEYNSICFDESNGDIIVLVNDDMIINTKGWDENIRQLDERIVDKIYLAYGNDLFKKGDLCTFPILSRKTCQVLQKPYHPIYQGAFIDYHLMDIFKRLENAGFSRIFYLHNVVFEHLHYRTGKAELDGTYKARGRFDDDMLFISLVSVRKESLKLLVNAIKNTSQRLDKLKEPKLLSKPSNLFIALVLFSKKFLFDKMLPIKWRFFLWWWFLARYMASYILK